MNIKDFFNSLTPEQIEQKNNEQFEENKRVYIEFKGAYEKGECSLCHSKLDNFSENNPCFHWFLKPNGIKKKDFKKYLSTPINYFQFDSYIRWMANLDKPFRNINDLKEEMNPSKVAEYTVKYKNIEWTISISENDKKGHLNSNYAEFPHFHIQMKVDNQIFIRFNDFHIPLSEADIFTFTALEEASDKIEWRNSFGEGMAILEDIDSLEQIDHLMTRTDDIENGTFNTGTMVQMPQGETMDGETLEKIFEESRKTKKPIRHLINKYFPQAKIITEIRPGDGVPEIKKRNTRK